MSTPNPPTLPQSSMKAFGLTWAGQLLSLIGSGLTSFALGIEVYKRTGSITKLSLVTFFATAPYVVASPIAGALVDRWNRRTALLLSDLGAGICTMFIWGLIAAGEAGFWPLEVWHFYIPFAVSSLFAALRGPALSAATSQLVPKQHLGRANGMIELATGSSQLISPVLAGALVVHIGLQGVVLIDMVSFIFAVGSLLLVRFPSLAPTAQQSSGKRSLREDVANGWRFIRTQPGLIGLLVSTILPNLIFGLVAVLITPLVLKGIANADADTLGRILSMAGLGTLAGAITMGITGGPKRLVRGALAFQFLAGLVLLGGALPASVLTVTLCAGLFLFTVPLMSGTLQTVWQRKVPHGMQGRVFSTRRMIATATAPLSPLLAGPLADWFFEPWLAPGGALANSVGRVVGTGPGRGIGFMFVVMGLSLAVNALIVWSLPRVRNLEDDMPDAVPDNVTRLPENPGAEQAPALSAASGGSK